MKMKTRRNKKLRTKKKKIFRRKQNKKSMKGGFCTGCSFVDRSFGLKKSDGQPCGSDENYDVSKEYNYIAAVKKTEEAQRRLLESAQPEFISQSIINEAKEEIRELVTEKETLTNELKTYPNNKTILNK